MTFHLMCVNIILISVWVAGWPPFAKLLLSHITTCSLCILTICISEISSKATKTIESVFLQFPGLCYMSRRLKINLESCLLSIYLSLYTAPRPRGHFRQVSAVELG